MKRRNQSLSKLISSRSGDRADKRLVNGTLAVIPFIYMAARDWDQRPNYKNGYEIQKIELRKSFLEATVWSVYYHVRHIVVFVNNDDDVLRVSSLNLPIWRVINLHKLFWSKSKRALQTPRNLPKESLLHLVKSLQSDSDYKNFDYIYYTEMDQVLHLRRPVEIMDTIDENEGRVAILPHRLQVSGEVARDSCGVCVFCCQYFADAKKAEICRRKSNSYLLLSGKYERQNREVKHSLRHLLVNNHPLCTQWQVP